MPTIDADVCVVGAGSGGLSVAAATAQLGLATVLIERGAMGGDCLNTGCVPSKSLIAAARAAYAVRSAGRFGIAAGEPRVDHAAVAAHIAAVIAAIAPHDSQERFEGLGVRVIRAHARFIGPDRLEAGGVEVRARRFVLATGSRPFLPPIPGLDAVPVLTNETVFTLAERPRHLLVIGAGPIGLELAQAHRRLGADVTVLERATALPKEDPELASVVRAALAAEGVVLREGVEIARVDAAAEGLAVVLAGGGRVVASHLLVAAGRRAEVEDLGLAAAGIKAGPAGVKVDARLRTTNPRVFAVGDVAGGPQFTHLAGHHAGIVVRNIAFRLPAKAAAPALPRVTFTDPELAQSGLTEAEARAAGHRVEIARWPFAENDRARTEARPEGLVKAVLGRRGRILGCGIVGAEAGELILPWVLAIERRLPLSALATTIAPYPTRGEASKRAAGSHFSARLFSAGTRRLVRLLARLP
jgi:pyruvate/2-oxoglutarate dehydrogenase complex dihydrolipoamide dehydrogenase (E3) component